MKLNLLSNEQIERVFDYNVNEIVEMSDDSSSDSCGNYLKKVINICFFHSFQLCFQCLSIVSTFEPTKTLRHSIARMNLSQYVKESFVKESTQDYYEFSPTDSSGNESEKIVEIKSFQSIKRSISNSSIISSFSNKINGNSSKTNLLLAPVSSAASITDRQYCKFFNDTDYLSKSQKMLLMKDEHDVKTLGFTRNQMKRRLENLVKIALSNDSGHKDVIKSNSLIS